MPVIKILDTHTINKIAAGEVVERPCSVVKELVENSVDAKASSITVEIKNGGVDLIRVTDNGIGIPKEQVEIAFLRHATSKITKAEDLYDVTSLGFRGEALASIAAVSHVELFTKIRDDVTGKHIEVSAGKITSAEETACPDGTTFIMRHLFYNVPARKAFLMTNATEAGKISDYMYKLALAHPEISFKYIQNGKIVFTTSGDHKLRHCVLNIYGKEYARHTFECYYKENSIECAGLLGDTTLNRSNRNYEHFFINGRYIKNQILQNAVEEAYKTLVMTGKFPFVILHINMDPALVDVNVHPTKLQVRFKNIELMHNIVFNAVSNALRNQILVPDVNVENPGKEAKVHHEVESQMTDTFFTPRKEDNEITAVSMLSKKAPSEKHVIPEFNPYKPSLETVEKLFGPAGKEDKDECIQAADEKKEDIVSVYEQKAEKEKLRECVVSEKQASLLDNEAASKANTSEYRIIGQIFKTYWLVEYYEKVIIIDQHAAHERILYEQFMKYFIKGNINTQVLLVPETVRVTPAEKVLVEENRELFLKLGFVYEDFGETSIVIREVPYLINEPVNPLVFKDILDELDSKKIHNLADVKAESIIRMSCKSAVKGHDKLSEEECHNIINMLMKLENPFTCPHGRPTIVSLKQGDIEKMFKRI